MVQSAAKRLICNTDTQGNHSLIGSKCNECGKITFPAKQACPYCLTNGKNVELPIGSTGKVVTVTTCHTAPKGMSAPYSLGIVEIDGGVHVLSQIQGDDIHKGQLVELIVVTSSANDEQSETSHWKYRVVQGGISNE